MPQNFGQCVMSLVSGLSIKHVLCKSHVTHRKQFYQCFGRLTVGSCDKLQAAWQALKKLDFHLQKVFGFMAFHVTL